MTGPGAPFEVTETEVRGLPIRTYKSVPPSMREVWLGSALHADNDYLVYEDDRWTYTRAHQEVAAIHPLTNHRPTHPPTQAMAKKIEVMITAFRDGFQSVYGARVFTDDFMPAVEAARDAGIRHFEAGGGARFQALYFYSNEDAFEMMDTFREKAGPDANLQTLARGINVVALDSQPREIIDLHAKLFKRHGITTIRNFDALNDVNNLIYSGQAITEAGLKHQVCVTLMQLPPGNWSSQRHWHSHEDEFVYVLEGELTLAFGRFLGSHRDGGGQKIAAT